MSSRVTRFWVLKTEDDHYLFGFRPNGSLSVVKRQSSTPRFEEDSARSLAALFGMRPVRVVAKAMPLASNPQPTESTDK